MMRSHWATALLIVTSATSACNKDDTRSSSSSGATGNSPGGSSTSGGAAPAGRSAVGNGGQHSETGGHPGQTGGISAETGGISGTAGSAGFVNEAGSAGVVHQGGGAGSTSAAGKAGEGGVPFLSTGGGAAGTDTPVAGGEGGAGLYIPTGLASKVLANPTPYIPVQCYTDTKGDHGQIYNTCYTCHTKGGRPDFTDDAGLQLEYALPRQALTNPWTNLFENRSARVAAMSDAEILGYIRESNYVDDTGDIVLAAELQSPPNEWDFDRDGSWDGYAPDCYFDFDDEGFDRDPSGNVTGWRAYAYYPFPATHWPTNGSTTDAMIRLPEVFRTVDGVLNLDAYRLNLAIVEAVIKRRSVPIAPTDESVWGVDLDRNGGTNVATSIAFDWAPLQGRLMDYVGDAAAAQAAGDVNLAGGLFPVGTEFLSSNRYFDPGDSGTGAGRGMAPRFKELRYARKYYWQTYSQLSEAALDDVKDRHDFPDRVEKPIGDIEQGVANGSGWLLQGFIEDEAGALRPQTFEETAYCMGCHGGIGATTDSMFSMARKLDVGAYREGWYHWSQQGLEGLNEPKVDRAGVGVHYEYSYYLQYAGAGDELRANDEVLTSFFDVAGRLDQARAEALHEDVTTLLYPSRRRALDLAKSYKVIVEDQSFIYGREVVLSPATRVHEDELTQGTPTGVETSVELTASGRDLWHDTSLPPSDPVGSNLRDQIVGSGAGGPDGHAYGTGWDGIIDKSTYAEGSNVYFPFPRRDTLPVRYVVQNGSNPGCYTCHRLDSPTIPGSSPVNALALPATSLTEAGVTLTQLTTDGAADTGAVYSPDGARIAWVTKRSGVAQIWVMDADGNDKQAITSGSVTHSWPVWDAAGERLTFWAYDPDTGESSILVTPIDGGSAPVTLFSSTMGIEHPEFSPDGAYVSFSAEGVDGWDIWIAASDGSASPIRVTDDPQSETTALWRPGANPPELTYKACPGGTYSLCTTEILVFSSGLDSVPEIYTWSGPNSIQGYDWSNDGSRFAYTAEVLTAASGEDRVSYQVVVDEITLADGVTTNRPIVPSYGITLADRGPVFSPDSTRIAYWAWDRSNRATLWVANVDGSGLRQVTTQGFDLYPTWSADGTRLAFESYRAGNSDIWSVELD